MLLQRIASILLTIAALGVLALLPVINSPGHDFDYYGRVVSRSAPDFDLRDTTGGQARLSDFRGRFVYLMFGYLRCDRLCHSQALTFHMLNRRLTGDEVQFLYLDMDPARDTPEQIRRYFDHRAGNFTGLVASDISEAQSVAADYRAYFSRRPAQGATGYRIDHPGFIYLIDPSGRIRVIYTGAHLSVDRMLDDLVHLAEQANGA